MIFSMAAIGHNKHNKTVIKIQFGNKALVELTSSC